MATKARATLRLGRPPDPNSPAYHKDMAALVRDLARYVIELSRELEQHSQVNDRAAPNVYTATNVTTDRTFDADSTSTDELADVLGTVIADLQAKGVLS
jgi:hypothetical protein